MKVLEFKKLVAAIPSELDDYDVLDDAAEMTVSRICTDDQYEDPSTPGKYVGYVSIEFEDVEPDEDDDLDEEDDE
jgi:hypothetical protein